MEELDLRKIFKIDKKRLIGYFERTKKQYKQLPPLRIIAKFLENQSIGTYKDNSRVLKYYKDKIIEHEGILDLAFEWIRAQKIRLEYKKHLIRAQYGKNIDLAIDDCIFLFFLEHDRHVRKLFNGGIKEFEISALYEIFFSPYDVQEFNLKEILEKNEFIVPTLFEQGEKIDTSIITIREGLSEIIKKDYEGVLSSRGEQKTIKEEKHVASKVITTKKEVVLEFGGTGIERKVKTFCFNKVEIPKKDIEGAVNQFLTPYFKFGKFYKYDDFKDTLIENFAKAFYSGLTDKVKSKQSLANLKDNISQTLINFRTIHEIKKLDGMAWVVDLRNVLVEFMTRFTDKLFETQNEDIGHQTMQKTTEEKSDHEEIEFGSIFNLSLEIDEYRDKLEESLKDSGLGLIARRNLIRQKVQEFTMKKRK